MPKVYYEDYQGSQFDDLEELTESHSRTHVYGGLSAFDLPTMVDGEIAQPDTCSIRFTYADNEPAESRFHVLPGNPNVKLRIGKRSKKILQIEIQHASQLLVAGPLSFDPRVAFEWCRNSPERVMHSCIRNAAAVSKIMSTMPDSFRSKLVDALRSSVAARQGASK